MRINMLYAIRLWKTAPETNDQFTENDVLDTIVEVCSLTEEEKQLMVNIISFIPTMEQEKRFIDIINRKMRESLNRIIDSTITTDKPNLDN